jgi:hypothetical protein
MFGEMCKVPKFLESASDWNDWNGAQRSNIWNGNPSVIHNLVPLSLEISSCCSNVIMSGYGDENPDDEGREAVIDNTKAL